MSDAWTDPLLPPAQTRLEAALGRTFPPRGLIPEIITTLWHPTTCPAELLPWLAWALSVDEWDAAWPVEIQRAICAASFQVHKQKGTVGAVKRVMTALGYRTQIVESWQSDPPGAPHTFGADIEIDDRGIDASSIASMERQIDAVKPERSHYTLRLIGKTVERMKVACATLSGETVAIQPYLITEIAVPGARVTVGIGLHAYGQTTIYPLH